MADLQEKDMDADLYKKRLKTKKEYFLTLSHVMRLLEDCDAPSYTIKELSDGSFYNFGTLDVDEKHADSLNPRYFAPLSADELADTLKNVDVFRYDNGADVHWNKRCIAGTKKAENIVKKAACDTCDSFADKCQGIGEGTSRSSWLYNYFGSPSSSCRGIVHSTEWDHGRSSPDGKDPLPYGSYPVNDTDPTRPKYRGYQTTLSYEIADASAPHMMAVTVSTEVAGDDEILTSELLTATALMKRHARFGAGFFFRVFPILLISIQHDWAVRILQIAFDGESMSIRRSRRLILDGDVPCEDAYLILRWMGSKPVGETEHDMPDHTAGTEETPTIAIHETGAAPMLV